MGRRVRVLDASRGAFFDMSLERIPDIPRPQGITDVRGVVSYLDRLATALQEHMSMRPEDFQNLVSGLTADEVNISVLSSPTYDTVQDFINQQANRTHISGMIITDNYTGTVAVSAGTGFIKTSNDLNAEVVSFDFAGANTAALTDESVNYIYLDYNDGTPQLAVDTTGALFYDYDHIILGCAYRHGTHCHIINSEWPGVDSAHRTKMTFYERDGGGRRTAGLLTSSAGTRNLAITAGVLWVGLTRVVSLSFNTSTVDSGTADATETLMLHDADGGFTANDVGKTVKNTTDTTYTTVVSYVDSGQLLLEDDIFISGETYQIYDSFRYWYTDDSGATWTSVDHSTQISNSQYNNIATGLANLVSNRYGVHWVYIGQGGMRLQVVYGQGSYTASEAELASVPSVLPPVVSQWGILLAKVICQEGESTFKISYPWSSSFRSSLAADHGSLTGLSDNDHPQYALLEDIGEAMYTTSVLKVYPDLAAPVTVTSDTSAWAWTGTYTQIVPASTITSDFVIYGAKVTRDDTVSGEWQIRIASGAAESEVVKMNFVGDSENDTNAGSVLITPIPVKFSANDRISAEVTDVDAATRNYQVKILYYELPL